MDSKLAPIDELVRRFGRFGTREHRVIFTNGCFDPIHHGHLTLLRHAKDLGGTLVVSLNSDASIRAIKGQQRPRFLFADRLASLQDLCSVDHVVCQTERTPRELLAALQPDVLVKGGDYQVDQIVGKDIVLSYGGEVKSLLFVPGVSSTKLV